MHKRTKKNQNLRTQRFMHVQIHTTVDEDMHWCTYRCTEYVHICNLGYCVHINIKHTSLRNQQAVYYLLFLLLIFFYTFLPCNVLPCIVHQISWASSIAAVTCRFSTYLRHLRVQCTEYFGTGRVWCGASLRGSSSRVTPLYVSACRTRHCNQSQTQDRPQLK